MSTTVFPTLPATWSPSSQCIATDAMWYVVERTYTASASDPGGIIFSLMYGAPSPTITGTTLGAPPSGTCIPPSYTSDVPYLSDDNTCPSGYSLACESETTYNGQTASVVTCCQSGVYDFACATDVVYGCETLGQSGQTWPGSRTDFSMSTAQPNTFTVAGGNYLYAWGIRILATTPTSTSSSTVETGGSTSSGSSTTSMATNTSDPTTTQASSSASHVQSPVLSVTAKIGISVGATVVGLVSLALIGWFIFHRRKQARKNAKAPPQELAGAGPSRGTSTRETSAYYPPLYTSEADATNGIKHPYEAYRSHEMMGSIHSTHELHPSSPSELPSTLYHQ